MVKGAGVVLEYVDFEVKIERRQEREYAVSVSSPPGGEASGTFVLPFTLKRLKDIRETIEIALLRSMMPVRRVAPPEFEKVEEFGRELYGALFKDEVKSCFDRSYSVAFREGKGLRLKLRLDSTLANLPWEFMYSREVRDYLALCRTIPPMRYTELPQPVVPLEITPPLRILVVIASPSDYDLLNVERERERITSALGEMQERGIIKVEFVEGKSTLAALQRRLRRADYHVLHFIGHGDYDEQAEEGLLLMEDARGRGRPVSGQWLGRLLRGYFPMRLVALNACEGALTSSSDPFAGVAAAVVGAGVPAVVAMQFEISDEAAIIFSREFYSALADNYPVDAAVTEARIAIVHSRENTIEWATPVLYMRAPDGMLFALQEVPKRKPEEEKLAALYAQAKALLDAEKWSEAIARCEEILAINPSYRDAVNLLAEAREGLAQQEAEAEREKGEKRAALYERVVAAITSLPWPAAVMGGAALLVVLFGIVATVKPWGWLSTPTPTPTPTATPTATATSTPTFTHTPTSTPTYTRRPTFTPTSTPTPTSVPPTDTPRRPTVTPTSAQPTDTPIPLTATPRPVLTITPQPTAEDIPTVGGTWQSNGPTGVYVRVVAPSPYYHQDRTVYTADWYSSGYRTTDGGKTWQEVTELRDGVRTFWFSRLFDMDKVILAGSLGDLWRSTDRGHSWTSVLSGGDYMTSAVDWAMFVESTYEGTLYKSLDNGQTWTAVGPEFPDEDSYWVSVGGVSPYGGGEAVFASTTLGLYRSIDGGETWQDVELELDQPYRARVAFSPYSPVHGYGATLFVVADGKAWKSTDGGDSWHLVSSPIVGDITAIAFSPDYQSDGAIYVGFAGDGVFRVTENEQSWAVLGEGLGNKNIETLVIARGTPPTLFAGTYDGVWQIPLEDLEP